MPKWLCHLEEPGPGAGLSGTSLSIAGDSLADSFLAALLGWKGPREERRSCRRCRAQRPGQRVLQEKGHHGGMPVAW